MTRRSVEDPEAVAYALSCAFVGAGAGFAWLATDWPATEPGQAGAFATFVDLGDIWVPLVRDPRRARHTNGTAPG